MEHPATILVVDDESAMLDALAATLRGQGFAVLTAEDGLQALEVLGRLKPDLIITDISMPRMNGYQLYERVSANPEWVWIPFIFLTGRTEDADMRFGKELGVDDYLRKPVDPEDLLATVLGRLKRFSRLEQQRAEGAGVDQRSAAERYGLTERETEVLGLMVRGLTNDQIAGELRIAPTTAKSHVASILSKLNVRSRVEAVALALRQAGAKS